MLDYALSRYDQYFVFFYLLLILLLLLEWPITIFTLSLLAPKLNLWPQHLLLLALIGDFGGDLLHFYLGKYGHHLQKLFKRTLNSRTITTLKRNIDRYPLLEKLIIIKYTPPLTSAGLIYLGFSQIKTKDFIHYTFPLCLLSSSLIVLLSSFFNTFLINQSTLRVSFLGIGLSLFLLISLIKYLRMLLITRIQKKYQKPD